MLPRPCPSRLRQQPSPIHVTTGRRASSRDLISSHCAGTVVIRTPACARRVQGRRTAAGRPSSMAKIVRADATRMAMSLGMRHDQAADGATMTLQPLRASQSPVTQTSTRWTAGGLVEAARCAYMWPSAGDGVSAARMNAAPGLSPPLDGGGISVANIFGSIALYRQTGRAGAQGAPGGRLARHRSMGDPLAGQSLRCMA